MSEMRRAAAGLVERRVERFESHHGLEESRSRLRAALERAKLRDVLAFEESWQEEDGRAVLVATFEPSGRVKRFLEISSLVFALMIGASAWILFSTDESAALRFLLPLVTVFGVLGFPFVALAIASRRDARESQLRRAVARAFAADDTAGTVPPAR